MINTTTMNIKKFFSAIVCMAIIAISLSSCVHSDDWETPPINCNNKFAAPNTTMADFMAMAPATGFVLINTDVIFDGYIVSSDENGNFYKTISFQDDPTNPTRGLQMEIDRAGNYADFPVGAHVRINANGLRLGLDRGVIKIGAVDPTFAIGRIPSSLISRYISGVCNGNGLDIQKIVPKPLSSLNEAKQQQYVNILVTVPNVQFTAAELGKTYLNYSSGAGIDTDRNIEDVTGATTIIRNSGFATFGSTLIPDGSGDLTFVVSKYNNDYQMLIRNLNDVKFDKSRLVIDIENFDSYATSTENFLPKYYNISVVGSKKWYVQSFSNNKYIQISGFNAGPVKTQFAIPVDFNTKSKLSFKTNAGYYNGEVLKVYYSTNYDPANPTAATLNDITSQFDISKGLQPGVPGGNNYEASFRSSGIGSFTATGNGYIIFEYNSSHPGGSGISTVMQLDAINIF